MGDWLRDGFATGGIVDALMVLLIAEGLLLGVLARNKSRVDAVIDAGCIVVPGLFLMLAVKLALIDADWRLIAASLAGAGLAHAVDVARRLRP